MNSPNFKTKIGKTRLSQAKQILQIQNADVRTI